jgi:hypothetical protein
LELEGQVKSTVKGIKIEMFCIYVSYISSEQGYQMCLYFLSLNLKKLFFIEEFEDAKRFLKLEI